MHFHGVHTVPKAVAELVGSEVLAKPHLLPSMRGCAELTHPGRRRLRQGGLDAHHKQEAQHMPTAAGYTLPAACGGHLDRSHDTYFALDGCSVTPCGPVSNKVTLLM